MPQEFVAAMSVSGQKPVWQLMFARLQCSFMLWSGASVRHALCRKRRLGWSGVEGCVMTLYQLFVDDRGSFKWWLAEVGCNWPGS